MARPKDPQLERLWRRRLARHSTGGLSIAEFCSRERITSSSFSYWKRRLAAAPSPAPLNPPLFVPLRLEDTRPGGPPSSPAASSSSCRTRYGSASTPCPSPNGSVAWSPRSPAWRPGRRTRDHAPPDRPRLPLHPAHRHAQGLRGTFLIPLAARAVRITSPRSPSSTRVIPSTGAPSR